MATKKKAPDYSVREPGPDDAIDLLGILGSAGVDGEVGNAVGLAIRAFQSEEEGAQAVLVQAASRAVTGGLSSALRDRDARVEAKWFIYRLWRPKLTIAEGENYEEQKAKAWDALPMRGPLEIVESFRKTESFSDFLDFFTSMLPTGKDSTDSSTPSKEPTDIKTKTS